MLIVVFFYFSSKIFSDLTKIKMVYYLDFYRFFPLFTIVTGSLLVNLLIEKFW